MLWRKIVVLVKYKSDYYLEKYVHLLQICVYGETDVHTRTKASTLYE